MSVKYHYLYAFIDKIDTHYHTIMDLDKFNKNVARKKNLLIVFLRKLDEKVPQDFPQLVEEEDMAMWKETDCTACANCCKTMTPTFDKQDIQRIAQQLRMSPKDFTAKWLYKEEETGEMMNQQQPCQFLVDDKCSIYEFRPKDCREFPHHDKKPFDDYNETFIGNISRCPATFRLIERLQKRVVKEYEW